MRYSGGRRQYRSSEDCQSEEVGQKEGKVANEEKGEDAGEGGKVSEEGEDGEGGKTIQEVGVCQAQDEEEHHFTAIVALSAD